MQPERRKIPARLTFLYTNIGRGHPFYLDGIVEALVRSQAIGLVRRELDVFEVSRGRARLAWKAARWLYHKGSSGGPVGAVYRRLRSSGDYNERSRLMALMGRDLVRLFATDPDPLVIAHPSLAGILAGKPELIYQHGEAVVPDEALVAGATTVLVPTRACRERFVDFGYRRDQVVVTGLCVEPALVKQAADAFVARQERYRSADAMVGAFYSSGAEPRVHVHRLIAAAISAVQAGIRVILPGRQGGALLSKAALAFQRRGVPYAFVDSTTPITGELPPALLVSYSNRREETILTARLFGWYDFVVAPPHERSNWALGLGLPMFLVGPDIGPFAPLNRSLVLESGVAEALESSMDAHLFGPRIKRLLESGDLAEMSTAGWGKREINGFGRIAAFFVSKYGQVDL